MEDKDFFLQESDSLAEVYAVHQGCLFSCEADSRDREIRAVGFRLGARLPAFRATLPRDVGELPTAATRISSQLQEGRCMRQ